MTDTADKTAEPRPDFEAIEHEIVRAVGEWTTVTAGGIYRRCGEVIAYARSLEAALAAAMAQVRDAERRGYDKGYEDGIDICIDACQSLPIVEIDQQMIAERLGELMPKKAPEPTDD